MFRSVCKVTHNTPIMKHLLQVTRQGVQGRNAKTEAAGYANLCVKTNGCTLVEISADNFTGSGNDYKKRENILIRINWNDKGDHKKGKNLIGMMKLKNF